MLNTICDHGDSRWCCKVVSSFNNITCAIHFIPWERYGYTKTLGLGTLGRVELIVILGKYIEGVTVIEKVKLVPSGIALTKNVIYQIYGTTCDINSICTIRYNPHRCRITRAISNRNYKKHSTYIWKRKDDCGINCRYSKIVLFSVAAIVTGTIALVLIVIGHVGKGVVMSRMRN